MLTVFLDFDGVVHALGSTFFFSPKSLHALEEALAPYDPQIVISSSWRETATLEELTAELGPLARYVTAITPYGLEPAGTPGKRDRECKQYLIDNDLIDKPWLAIDDMERLFPESCPNLFVVDPSNGFTHQDVPKLKYLINEIMTRRHTGVCQICAPEVKRCSTRKSSCKTSRIFDHSSGVINVRANCARL